MSREKIKGTAQVPRLSVFRSNKHVFAQLIDDQSGRTLAFASDFKLTAKSSRLEKARAVGLALAKVAKVKKITKTIFDRDGYKYHGRVKALAEGAREGGLNF